MPLHVNAGVLYAEKSKQKSRLISSRRSKEKRRTIAACKPIYRTYADPSRPMLKNSIRAVLFCERIAFNVYKVDISTL